MTKKQAAEVFERLAGDLEELTRTAHVASATLTGTRAKKHRENEREVRI